VLADLIEKYANGDGITETAVDGLILYRASEPLPRTPVCYEPTICVVATTGKRLHVGDSVWSYDPDNYLINAMAMPVEGEIPEASPDNPYLGLSLRIDAPLVQELLLELERHALVPECDSPELIAACPITTRLESAFARLLTCCEDPTDAAVMSTAIRREIYYEVLRGDKGAMLKNSVLQHAGANRMAPVIQYLEENFHRPLEISEIADVAGMSSSTLHEHFKQTTSLSPLQFVKSLRLHRARALLLQGQQAAQACWQVGYSSPSQFSREFKRFFGESPRDVISAGRP